MKITAEKYTIIIVAFLLIGIISTTYLILNNFFIETEATLSEEPTFINIGNNTQTSFTVAWITTKETQGSLNLINEKISIAEKKIDKVHFVEISNLKPNTEYLFSITTEGMVDDNRGKGYNTKTLGPNDVDMQDTPSASNYIIGRVLKLDGQTPFSKGYIVVKTIKADNRTILSSITNNGLWKVEQGDIYSKSAAQSDKQLVSIEIYTPYKNKPATRTYELNLSEIKFFPDFIIDEELPEELPAVEDGSL